MLRWFSAALCFLVLISPGPASAWVEEVVEEVKKAANDARCVGFVAMNDMVHILNAPSDRAIILETEERTAVIDLTRALSGIGRFRVTRGGALSYEAVTRANTPAGRQELSATLDRLSDAAMTVFFAPYARENGFVRAEITLLARRHENGAPMLACTPTIWVDIPAGVHRGGPEPEPDPHARIAAFVASFHDMANRPGSCIEMGRFYAPVIVVDGNTRTRSEQVRLRCEIENLNPELFLHQDSIRVTDFGGGRYGVSYANTARVDEKGRRVTTDWFVDTIIEDTDGRLQYTRIDPTSRRR